MKMKQNFSIVSLVITIFLSTTILIYQGCTSKVVLADLPMLYDPKLSDYFYPGAFLISMTINSREYSFKVDTCSSHTTVDKKLEPLLGDFITTKEIEISFFNTNSEEKFYEPPKDFRMGKAAVMCDMVGCSDIERGSEVDSIVDGIIGMNILDKKVLQLDFENKHIRILQIPCSGRSDSRMENYERKWGHPIVLIRDSFGIPYINVALNDAVVEPFTVDTGLWGPNFLRKNIFDELKDQKGILYITAGQDEGIVIREVSIADSKISHVFLVSRPESILPAYRSIFGSQFLSRFKMLTFDFLNNKLYLKPKEGEPVRIELEGNIVVYP